MHYNVINECTSKGGGALSQLTIRGIGVELHNALKESARRKGLSLNRYVVAILREAAGLGYEVTWLEPGLRRFTKSSRNTLPCNVISTRFYGNE